MARKNIFQLVEESYDVQNEIKKINRLFFKEEYFEEDGFLTHSFEEILKKHLFADWKYRGTCITLEEYFQRVDAECLKRSNVSEKSIINNLESMENFVKLYSEHSAELYQKYKIKYFTTLETVFCELIKTLEKRMGLSKREYKDKIILYPKNAPLEKVISLFNRDEDVQWELIRYVREDLSLAEKRKSLAYLATNLYIEQDKSEENIHLQELLEKAGNILNNLHIRHNNKTGKWENQVLKELDEADAISLCDMVYNEMLTIVLLREHKEYEKTYEAFNKRQKATKAKK